jgi:hypothetical protein
MKSRLLGYEVAEELDRSRQTETVHS